MSREISPREEWFRSKVGQRLFRNHNGCSCEVCQHVLDNGLIVENPLHATYLYDNECDYTNEGNPLRYFDTKEEATEFSVNLEK